jgi:hypothetical protein
MRNVASFLAAAVVGMGIAGLEQARADLLNFGATYNIAGNFGTLPGNVNAFSDTITLSDGPQLFNGGADQISENTTALAGGAEFVEFYITTTSLGPLVPNAATNGNGFDIYLNNIPLVSGAISSNYYFNWATDAEVNIGIAGSGGIQVEANPNSGSIGAGLAAFYFAGATPSKPAMTTAFGQYQFPMDIELPMFRSDPDANAYFLGIELIPAAVPEPSTWALILAGFAGLSLAGYRASRRSVVLPV